MRTSTGGNYVNDTFTYTQQKQARFDARARISWTNPYSALLVLRILFAVFLRFDNSETLLLLLCLSPLTPQNFADRPRPGLEEPGRTTALASRTSSSPVGNIPGMFRDRVVRIYCQHGQGCTVMDKKMCCQRYAQEKTGAMCWIMGKMGYR